VRGVGTGYGNGNLGRHGDWDNRPTDGDGNGLQARRPAYGTPGTAKAGYCTAFISK